MVPEKPPEDEENKEPEENKDEEKEQDYTEEKRLEDDRILEELIPDDIPESQRKTSFLSTSGKKRTSYNEFEKFSGGRRSIVSDLYFKISEF